MDGNGNQLGGVKIASKLAALQALQLCAPITWLIRVGT